LPPMPFCAVTYHPNDDLVIRSPYVALTDQRTNIKDDIERCLTRNVFVVQADSIIQFLGWLDYAIFESKLISIFATSTS
jgi:hypothetical protein